MPSETQHIRQARANAQFLGELRQPTMRHADWTVTVALYAALHLVDAFFARELSLNCDNHPDRNRAVSFCLRQIAAQYLSLYLASKRARYDCQPPSPGDAESELHDNYEPIRQHMCTQLGVMI